MASINKKKCRGYTYYQIVESKRVNGKPRPIVLWHLGTANSLLKKLRSGVLKKKIHSWSHGAVISLWHIGEQMGFINLFKKEFSNNERDGIPVGISLLLAAIHRAVSPGSKRAFADWASETTLPQIAGFDPVKLDSQHFWDQMDTVTEKQLEDVEKQISIILKNKGLLCSSLLFYDTTNFFTFIDSDNNRCDLPKRGKNKQKRDDLRQFGLAQVVTREFLIPICSKVYEGNQSDSKLFMPNITELRNKLIELEVQIEDMTIVFDKGNNSKENFVQLDKMEQAYVASLSAAHHEDLINIPKWRYWTIFLGEKKIRCYRTKKLIWGKERTVVLYLSEILREGQIRGLQQELAKKINKLQELKNDLNSKKAKPRSREVLVRTIKNILHGERGDFLIDVNITKRRGKGLFDIDWRLDELAYDWITKVLFGKRILVTCREEWTETEIVSAYYGLSHVERFFRHIKNPYHHAVRPQFHWTDQKIMVHTFICLTGFLLSQILLKKVTQAGHKISIDLLLHRLSKIRQAETIELTGLKGSPIKSVQLEEMDDDLRILFDDSMK